MSAAPISLCLIHRDDPHLPRTIASLRPYVAEVCIVHTPCAVFDAAEVRALADRYDEMPAPGGGSISDFAEARTRSFALATQPVVMWADSDDLVVGVEHLAEVAAALESGQRVLCPYEYSTSAEGECEVLQWRERIVRNDGRYHWTRPCHETLVARDGQSRDIREPRIVWKHTGNDSPAKAGRSLRILRAYEAAGHGDDPWTLLNLATELRAAGRLDEAARYYVRYLGASGWDDERAMAMLALSDCLVASQPTGPFARATEWIERAADLRPSWFEPAYADGKLAALRGLTGDRRELDRAREVLADAVRRPATDTPLVTRPLDRTLHAPKLLGAVCAELGDYEGALDAIRVAIARRPDDAGLRLLERTYEHALHPATSPGRLDIVFGCGPTGEPWNPEIVARSGMGGSETAVVEMARRLADRGHRVRVMASVGAEGLYGGVEYLDSAHLAEVGASDVVVVWRNAAVVDYCQDARARLLWCHDTQAHALTESRLCQFDRVLALTKWHARRLQEVHDIGDEQMVVTRNGIDLARFDTQFGRCVDGSCDDKPGPRDPHRIIYSSSPDRGLAVLLDVWPQIRARVPDAALDVYYGFAGWERAAKSSNDRQHQYLIESMKRRMRDLDGVTDHGRIDQWKLARAMMGAGVWCGSLWFPETSCISAMEAQAAGCRIVAHPVAAMSETVGDRGTLVDGDWLDEGYQNRIADAVVSAMLRPEDGDRDRLQSYARDNFSWDGVAAQWEALFAEVLSESEWRCGVGAYREVAA